jgi:nucleoid-associated protein
LNGSIPPIRNALMSLTINYAVVHELVKEKDSPPGVSKIKDKVLPIDNEIVIKLVEGVSKIYGKKNNSADYGVFSTRGVLGTFPTDFAKYYKRSDTTGSEFLSVSEKVMIDLRKSVLTNMPATGGYILFSDYEEGGNRFLIIAMLKDKAGLKMSEDLVPEELEHIDLNHLHQAARMSFNKYTQFVGAADDLARSEINYLSFVSPASSKKVAGYFISAIGCTKGTASAQATKLVVREVASFVRNNEAIGTDKARMIKSRQVKDDVVNYLHDCLELGHTARLSAVDGIARRYFPSKEEGEADRLSDELFSVLNGEDVGIPTEFSVNGTEAKKYTVIKHEAPNWKVEFKRNALGYGDDAEIQYDKGNGSLIIHGMSAELKEIVESDLKERGIKEDA